MGKCKKCGVEVPKEAMFCPNCGAGVSKEASVEKLSGGKGRRKKKYAMIGGGIGAILFILEKNERPFRYLSVYRCKCRIIKI